MQFFISGDRPNVAGLVLAGSAEFKTELSDSDMFDQRLKAAVLAVVDVSYGAQSSLAIRNYLKPLACCRRDLANDLNFKPAAAAWLNHASAIPV